METGKTSKYLKYAIGEILLVVIGILIALQINNWNEDRKDRRQETELLIQLQSEFRSNLEQLDEKIEMRNEMISASLKLFDYIDHPDKRNRDSILKYIGQTILAPTFDPIVNDLASSGRIQFLQNPELKEKLSRWTSEIIQVTEEEVEWRDRRGDYTAELIEHSSYRNILSSYWRNGVIESILLDRDANTDFLLQDSKKSNDLSALLDHSNFEDYIATCATFSKLTNSQSLILRNRIDEILILIEQELKK